MLTDVLVNMPQPMVNACHEFTEGRTLQLDPLGSKKEGFIVRLALVRRLELPAFDFQLPTLLAL